MRKPQNFADGLDDIVCVVVGQLCGERQRDCRSSDRVGDWVVARHPPKQPLIYGVNRDRTIMNASTDIAPVQLQDEFVS